ncbi:hypothetical protein Y1Q_0010063 [Alligator mississippiensis]|uniref:Uncharacterized protein n=1 Tax=Alligator mississippiensis TaxID=8496 RepID=A0A151P449_ALLMI|nr:hypothetical protein Y1Q_0010063 [Alligator mississippiensis]
MLSSAPKPQQAQGPSNSTLVLPQLHKAGGHQGQLLLQPPPGQPKANWRGARLWAPVQDLPLCCPQVRDKMGPGPGPKDRRQDIQSNQEREAQEQIKKMKERLLINKVQCLVAQEIRDRLQQLHQQQLRVQEAEIKAQQMAFHEKEPETAHLKTLQQRVGDFQAKKDMLQVKQHKEAKEREKQQSLLEQMACKEHQQVKQTKRHCSYFEQVVR